MNDPNAAQIKADEILASNPGTWISLSWSDAYVAQDQIQGPSTPHPWNPEIDVATDTLIAYYNDVVDIVEASDPGHLYGFLAYMNYIMPPVNEPLNSRLSPIIAPIEQCPLHIPGAGNCWQRDLLFDGIQDWTQMSDNAFIYDYEPGFLITGHIPMPSVTRQRVEVPLLAQYGLRGFLHQSQLTIMNQGPNLYVMSKLMWDADANVDALLDDYYDKLFGPAAAPVRTYWDTLENLFHSSPVHHHEDEIAKIIYPIDTISQLGTYISQAESLADTSILQQRVQAIRYSYDNLMLYLQFRQAEDRGRFAQAANLAQQMLDLHYEVDAFDTALYKLGDLNWNSENQSYQTGGWITHNQGRVQRTEGTIGYLADMLPAQWTFQTDPNDEGIAQGWFDPEHDTSAWGSILTTQIWEAAEGMQDEAGHGYNGAGWYRTELLVPVGFDENDQFFLNFGGVFGSMQIYIDGVLVAERPYQDPWWYNPFNEFFDIDISGSVTPGQSNDLVIRVDNDFEWGGIYRRIFAWSPDEPAPMLGDVNCDGFVGADDLVAILSNWGLSYAYRSDGDLTGDGFVGADDYVQVLGFWGDVYATEPIPEPATLGSLLLAGLALLKRRAI